MSSVALLLATHSSFAAITSGKPADISPNYFTVADNVANCDITGVQDMGTSMGSGAASDASANVICTGNGTSVGSSTLNCLRASISTKSITKPTTTLNVGALYFKQVSGAWQRYPGWFTLDSSCNATNFYYDGCLQATINIGQTSGGTNCAASPLPTNAPIDLHFSKQVETYSTEIELK